MKHLWLGRLARPDLMKAITDLSSHLTKWSRNDDKRLYRLVCYLNSTVEHMLSGTVQDPPEKLQLSLFVDADFAGSDDNAKSTNGGLLALAGPHTSLPNTMDIQKTIMYKSLDH